MKGINQALKNNTKHKNSLRMFIESKHVHVPTVFISYQREDERYANDVSEYIMSEELDVYFDVEDSDLKFQNQINNPEGVTIAIKKGLNKAEYMLVIISPSTYKSPWVPFEVGYAYDEKGNNLKLLRHKDINKAMLPSYLKVKEMLNGTISLQRFLTSIKSKNIFYKSLLEKHEGTKTFSAYSTNPLNKYLDNQ